MGLVKECLDASQGLPPGVIARRAASLLAKRGRDLVQKTIDRHFETEIPDERFEKIISRCIEDPREAFHTHIAFPKYCLDLNLLSQEQKTAVDFFAEQAFLHRFDLLGSGEREVSYHTSASCLSGVSYQMGSPGREEIIATKMAQTAQKASSFVNDNISSEFMNALMRYRPIDWHLDFKSGWRWQDRIWYKDIQYGQPAVDIKVPWELSRFQHLLYLAFDSKTYHWEVLLQVLDWIVSNPQRKGVNWVTTMDVAIRAANWIAAVSVMAGSQPLPRWFLWLLLKSLYAHGIYISKNLEYSPWRTGNHYLSDIVGLLSISSCFPFPESPIWSSFGLQELVSEMGRTVYADGCNYEASTNYHRLVTELFYHGTSLGLRLNRNRLLNKGISMPRPAPRLMPLKQSGIICDNPSLFPDWYFDRLKKMAYYVDYLCMPDGNSPSFGDMDNGRFMKLTPVAIKNETEYNEKFIDHRHILGLASGLFPGEFIRGKSFQFDGHFVFGGLKVSLKVKDSFGPSPEEPVISLVPLPFSKSGIFVLKAPGLWLAMTNSATGQNGFGGHSHNDNLSFELRTEDLHIFDPGTYLYTPDPELRNRFRSTSVHSTWMIDGEEQLSLDDGLFNLKSQVSFFPKRQNLHLRPTVIEADERSWMGRFTYGGQQVTRKVEIIEGNRDPDTEGYPVVWAIACGEYLVLFKDAFNFRSNAELSMFSNISLKSRLRIFLGVHSVREEISNYSPAYGCLAECYRTILVRESIS